MDDDSVNLLVICVAVAETVTYHIIKQTSIHILVDPILSCDPTIHQTHTIT